MTTPGTVTPGCYAAPLGDCDGGPLTREHYISRTLLEKFGKTFLVEGVTWASEPRRVSPASAMWERMLCKHHNKTLSPLDATIGNLYTVLRDAHDGRQAGAHQLDGEDLERWAIKVLLGIIASGAMDRDSRDTVIPDRYLRILFGRDEMDEGCGFFYVGDKITGFDADLLTVAINRYPEGDPEAGSIFGITIRLPGFQFITSIVCRLEVRKQRLVYRPDGFQLGGRELGRIGLRWKGQQGTRGLVLRMPTDSPADCGGVDG